MRRTLETLLLDRAALIGANGTAWMVILERVHIVLGILVGSATLVYLVLKIRKELKRR